MEKHAKTTLWSLGNSNILGFFYGNAFFLCYREKRNENTKVRKEKTEAIKILRS